jgi:hypothetical protein
MCIMYTSIKAPLKSQPENGFKKAETRSCYVLLINYNLCDRDVLWGVSGM